MNKFFIFALLVAFSVNAQDSDTDQAIVSPDTETSSETVTVPDIIDPAEENPIENGADAPAEEKVSDVPEPSAAPEPEIEETVPEATAEAEVKKEEPMAPKEAAAVVTTDMDEEKDFNIYESHWTTLISFETTKYPTTFKYNNNAQGKERSKVIDEPDSELFGGRLGFGGEVYIGAGLVTESRIEAYYLGSAFTKNKTANPDADATISVDKTTGSLYGVDVAQSLGFMFDFKTKNPFMDEMTYLVIQPFIEAGLGYAKAYQRTAFNYDKSNKVDRYTHSIEDSLVNARVGAGLNMTSRNGYFFYLRGTVNRYEVTDRKQEVSSRIDGEKQNGNEDNLDDKLNNPIIVYAIGGGYKF